MLLLEYPTKAEVHTKTKSLCTLSIRRSSSSYSLCSCTQITSLIPHNNGRQILPWLKPCKLYVVNLTSWQWQDYIIHSTITADNYPMATAQKSSCAALHHLANISHHRKDWQTQYSMWHRRLNFVSFPSFYFTFRHTTPFISSSTRKLFSASSIMSGCSRPTKAASARISLRGTYRIPNDEDVSVDCTVRPIWIQEHILYGVDEGTCSCGWPHHSTQVHQLQ